MLMVTAREGWSLRALQCPPIAGALARGRHVASPHRWSLHGRGTHSGESKVLPVCTHWPRVEGWPLSVNARLWGEMVIEGSAKSCGYGCTALGGKVASPCSGTMLRRGAQRVGSKALRLWLNVPRRHVQPPRDGGHCSGGVVMVGSMKSSSSTCTGQGETSSLSVVVVTAREGWSLRGVQSPPPTAALAMAHRAAFRHGGPCRGWVVIYGNLECVRCARLATGIRVASRCRWLRLGSGAR